MNITLFSTNTKVGLRLRVLAGSLWNSRCAIALRKTIRFGAETCTVFRLPLTLDSSTLSISNMT
jgi:hypothetical protein